jgi:hypothetical protein
VVAQRAHTPVVASSNLASATKFVIIAQWKEPWLAMSRDIGSSPIGDAIFEM